MSSLSTRDSGLHISGTIARGSYGVFVKSAYASITLPEMYTW